MTYLLFQIYDDTGKTKAWNVINNESGDCLGFIRWYGAWRKYCFFPHEDTVFCSKCLSEIVSFMQDQMKLRNRERSKK